MRYFVAALLLITNQSFGQTNGKIPEDLKSCPQCKELYKAANNFSNPDENYKAYYAAWDKYVKCMNKCKPTGNNDSRNGLSQGQQDLSEEKAELELELEKVKNEKKLLIAAKKTQQQFDAIGNSVLEEEKATDIRFDNIPDDSTNAIDENSLDMELKKQLRQKIAAKRKEEQYQQLTRKMLSSQHATFNPCTRAGWGGMQMGKEGFSNESSNQSLRGEAKWSNWQQLYGTGASTPSGRAGGVLIRYSTRQLCKREKTVMKDIKYESAKADVAVDETEDSKNDYGFFQLKNLEEVAVGGVFNYTSIDEYGKSYSDDLAFYLSPGETLQETDSNWYLGCSLQTVTLKEYCIYRTENNGGSGPKDTFATVDTVRTWASAVACFGPLSIRSVDILNSKSNVVIIFKRYDLHNKKEEFKVDILSNLNDLRFIIRNPKDGLLYRIDIGAGGKLTLIDDKEKSCILIPNGPIIFPVRPRTSVIGTRG
ncbi:hypothetical protein [Polluticoccus soli]|uniref:hypothetical protein n=1 Tax=Polluticoccus soli TaxID=3034150 RepID=UPI0023E2B265|nr:hypothetical protein [Flavipsychrobacter sp. JY13-12]